MELNFPIVVKNKRAFMKLMENIEKEHPEMIWSEGQKPTGYMPGVHAFPLEVCLFLNGRLYHHRIYKN